MLGRPVLLNIPPFPPTAAKLVRVLSRGDTSSRATELLQEDPAFSAEMIAWANQSFPELDGAVEDVRHVITLVGLERFRALAPEIAARLYMRGSPVYAELAPLWNYARSCASFAWDIASAEGFSPSRASVAAFLHDLGRVGLTVANPRKYAAFLQDAARRLAAGEALNLVARERELFNASRYEAGEWLARAWHFPDEVALAAGRHSRNEPQAPALIGIVRRACRMACDAGHGILPSPPAAEPRPAGSALTA
jgi:HD-like signal output (HDOD) protein